MANQILVIGNELANNGMTKKKADNLKDLITSDTIEVESKGVNTEVIPNFANFVLTTNNADAMRVDNGDRRLLILSLRDTHCKDSVYFKKLCDAIEDDQCVREFLTYLDGQYNVDEWNANQLPMTQLKQEMLVNSAPPFIQFILDNKTLFTDVWQTYVVDFVVLQDQYKKWIQENHLQRKACFQKRYIIRDVSIHFNVKTLKNRIDFRSADFIEKKLQRHFGSTFKWE